MPFDSQSSIGLWSPQYRGVRPEDAPVGEMLSDDERAAQAAAALEESGMLLDPSAGEAPPAPAPKPVAAATPRPAPQPMPTSAPAPAAAPAPEALPGIGELLSRSIRGVSRTLPGLQNPMMGAGFRSPFVAANRDIELPLSGYGKGGPGGGGDAPKPAAGSSGPSTTGPNVAAVAERETAPSGGGSGGSIEDLRRRFNLVEFKDGVPGPPQMDTAFGKTYRRISTSNAGPGQDATPAGRGSFSKMESTAYRPAIDPYERQKAENDAATARARAETEDLSPPPSGRVSTPGEGQFSDATGGGSQTVPMGTPPLPQRGAEIRKRQQEEIERARVRGEIAKIGMKKAAELDALRKRPDYALMTPVDKVSAEQAIHDAAAEELQSLFQSEVILRELRGYGAAFRR